jgi:hypothetical protein
MNAPARIARPAPKPKSFAAIVGSLPVLQYCAPEQLLIDDSYQRSLDADSSQALIRRIAAQWDWGLCQPLFVARRGDGGLYVVDGQHRLAAAVLRGDIPQLPCVVSQFDSATHEAAAFVSLNQQRRPLTALDLFKAALAAGDGEALKIKAALDQAGLRLASTTNNQTMKAGQVANVGGLQRCLRAYGDQVLATALRVLARAWQQQVLRYAGSIFPGIVAIVAGELNNRTAANDLVDRLAPFIAREPQNEWFRRFALAIANDPQLKRAAAAEKVLRAAWSDYSQGQLGRERPPLVAHDPGGCAPPVLTALQPNEIAWCDQCDQRVSADRAAACTSRFCSLKGDRP